MAEPASQWAKGENDGAASRGAQVNWRKGEIDGGTSLCAQVSGRTAKDSRGAQIMIWPRAKSSKLLSSQASKFVIVIGIAIVLKPSVAILSSEIAIC